MIRFLSNRVRTVSQLTLALCLCALSTNAQTPRPATPSVTPQPVTRQPATGQPATGQQMLPAVVAVIPKPLFNSSPPEQKQLVVEYIYSYTRTTYTPSVAIQPIARPGASYNTPEEAFITQISAMRAGDYEWWLSGFTTESQKVRKDRDVQIKRTPAEWKKIWAQALGGQRVLLLERVENGPYVVLLYSLRRLADDKETFRSIMPFKREENRWLTTLELAEDQFFHYYTEGKDRITIPRTFR